MKNIFLFSFILFSMMLILSLSIFVSANGDVPVTGYDVDPFLNETNGTSNQTGNQSDYLEGVTDETARKLIEALIGATEGSIEEKEYSDAIRKAFESGQKDFTDALGKIEYLVSEVIDERDKAVNDKDEYIRTTKVRMETMETEVESLRLGNERLKAWVFFYIVLGLAFGVLTMEVASYIRKNQKGYFIIRAIRDCIPIKF